MRVFYSWQSDIPTNTNRGFIAKALEFAIEDINRRRNLSLVLEQGSRDLPASPDVVESILHKIDNATVFIADVTPISKSGGKVIPNPNVMLELGYAIKTLTPARIITIHNDVFGDVRLLPFDLGPERQITYSVAPDVEDKADLRQILAKSLIVRMESILDQQKP